MGRKGRATFREVWNYIFHGQYPSRSREVKQMNIPGIKKLIIKLDPTLETITQQNSGEELFEILHSSLTIGVYDVLQEKMFEKTFQNYQLSELTEMRELLGSWEDPEDYFHIRTRDLSRLVDRAIETKEEQDDSAR